MTLDPAVILIVIAIAVVVVIGFAGEKSRQKRLGLTGFQALSRDERKRIVELARSGSIIDEPDVEFVKTTMRTVVDLRRRTTGSTTVGFVFAGVVTVGAFMVGEVGPALLSLVVGAGWWVLARVAGSKQLDAMRRTAHVNQWTWPP